MVFPHAAGAFAGRTQPGVSASQPPQRSVPPQFAMSPVQPISDTLAVTYRAPIASMHWQRSWQVLGSTSQRWQVPVKLPMMLPHDIGASESRTQPGVTSYGQRLAQVRKPPQFADFRPKMTVGSPPVHISRTRSTQRAPFAAEFLRQLKQVESATAAFAHSNVGLHVLSWLQAKLHGDRSRQPHS